MALQLGDVMATKTRPPQDPIPAQAVAALSEGACLYAPVSQCSERGVSPVGLRDEEDPNCVLVCAAHTRTCARCRRPLWPSSNASSSRAFDAERGFSSGCRPAARREWSPVDLRSPDLGMSPLAHLCPRCGRVGDSPGSCRRCESERTRRRYKSEPWRLRVSKQALEADTRQGARP